MNSREKQKSCSIGGNNEMEKKERILIVDDDVGVRKTLKLIFERSQYETEAVGTGKEAHLNS